MKNFGLALVCLLLASVEAEDNPLRSDTFNQFENKPEEKSSEKRWIQGNPSAQPQVPLSGITSYNVQSVTSKGQDRAIEEKTFKDFIPYDSIQSVLLNALKPKPIVDTAEESEKEAPNEGSGVGFLGDLVVKGSETVSRALNAVLGSPTKTFKKLSADATEALNRLGAYLVGL